MRKFLTIKFFTYKSNKTFEFYIQNKDEINKLKKNNNEFV